MKRHLAVAMAPLRAGELMQVRLYLATGRLAYLEASDAVQTQAERDEIRALRYDCAAARVRLDQLELPERPANIVELVSRYCRTTGHTGDPAYGS